MTPIPLPLPPPSSAGLGSESTALEAGPRDAPGGWLGSSPCRGGLSAGDVVTVLGRRGEYRVRSVHGEVVELHGDDCYLCVRVGVVRRVP